MSRVPQSAAIAIGLVFGCAGAALGLGLAGGGHGWVSAFFGGLVMIAAYPLAILRAGRDWRSRLADRVSFLVALSLDGWLIWSTADESGYVMRVWLLFPVSGLVWVVLWLGWQVVLVGAILPRDRRPLDSP